MRPSPTNPFPSSPPLPPFSFFFYFYVFFFFVFEAPPPPYPVSPSSKLPPNLLKATEHQIVPFKLIPDPIPSPIPLQQLSVLQHPRRVLVTRRRRRRITQSMLTFPRIMRDEQRNRQPSRFKDLHDVPNERLEVWERSIVSVGCGIGLSRHHRQRDVAFKGSVRVIGFGRDVDGPVALGGRRGGSDEGEGRRRGGGGRGENESVGRVTTGVESVGIERGETGREKRS